MKLICTAVKVFHASHRRAWSRLWPVKLKKLRYSSATMWLKSLLQRRAETWQTCTKPKVKIYSINI